MDFIAAVTGLLPTATDLYRYCLSLGSTFCTRIHAESIRTVCRGACMWVLHAHEYRNSSIYLTHQACCQLLRNTDNNQIQHFLSVIIQLLSCKTPLRLPALFPQLQRSPARAFLS